MATAVATMKSNNEMVTVSIRIRYLRRSFIAACPTGLAEVFGKDMDSCDEHDILEEWQRPRCHPKGLRMVTR